MLSRFPLGRAHAGFSYRFVRRISLTNKSQEAQAFDLVQTFGAIRSRCWKLMPLSSCDTAAEDMGKVFVTTDGRRRVDRSPHRPHRD
jgi:hypothetical protein